MAWADEIATLNNKIDEVQKKLDWINGVSREYSLGADVDGTVQYETRTAAGRDGFYADWRTDNPSASASSTGLELAMFSAWDEWNGTDLTSWDSEKNTELTTQKNELISDRDDLQAKIDDGTIVDAGA